MSTNRQQVTADLRGRIKRAVIVTTVAVAAPFATAAVAAVLAYLVLMLILALADNHTVFGIMFFAALLCLIATIIVGAVNENLRRWVQDYIKDGP